MVRANGAHRVGTIRCERENQPPRSASDPMNKMAKHSGAFGWRTRSAQTRDSEGQQLSDSCWMTYVRDVGPCGEEQYSYPKMHE